MATKEEVSAFLRDFHQKMKIWEIRVRDDRGKNVHTLLDLDINPALRMKVIEMLTTEDYSDGPDEDTLHAGAPLWVFGKTVKKTEIYIKVSLGAPSRPAVCVSFHPSEHPMRFPLKGD